MSTRDKPDRAIPTGFERPSTLDPLTRSRTHELRVVYPAPGDSDTMLWACWCGSRGKATRTRIAGGVPLDNDAALYQKAKNNHGAHRRRLMSGDG